jgi:hypothetical protein
VRGLTCFPPQEDPAAAALSAAAAPALDKLRELLDKVTTPCSR